MKKEFTNQQLTGFNQQFLTYQSYPTNATTPPKAQRQQTEQSKKVEQFYHNNQEDIINYTVPSSFQLESDSEDYCNFSDTLQQNNMMGQNIYDLVNQNQILENDSQYEQRESQYQAFDFKKEIKKRYKQSVNNKIYTFPRKIQMNFSFSSDSSLDSLIDICEYDLNSQNLFLETIKKQENKNIKQTIFTNEILNTKTQINYQTEDNQETQLNQNQSKSNFKKCKLEQASSSADPLKCKDDNQMKHQRSRKKQKKQQQPATKTLQCILEAVQEQQNNYKQILDIFEKNLQIINLSGHNKLKNAELKEQKSKKSNQSLQKSGMNRSRGEFRKFNANSQTRQQGKKVYSTSTHQKNQARDQSSGISKKYCQKLSPTQLQIRNHSNNSNKNELKKKSKSKCHESIQKSHSKNKHHLQKFYTETQGETASEYNVNLLLNQNNQTVNNIFVNSGKKKKKINIPKEIGKIRDGALPPRNLINSIKQREILSQKEQQSAKNIQTKSFGSKQNRFISKIFGHQQENKTLSTDQSHQQKPVKINYNTNNSFKNQNSMSTKQINLKQQSSSNKNNSLFQKQLPTKKFINLKCDQSPKKVS